MGNTTPRRRRSRGGSRETRSRFPWAVVALVIVVAAIGVYVATSDRFRDVRATVTGGSDDDGAQGTPREIADRFGALQRETDAADLERGPDRERLMALYVGMPTRLGTLEAAIDRRDHDLERKQRTEIARDFREVRAIVERHKAYWSAKGR